MSLLDKLNVVVNEPTFYLEDYVITIYGVPGAGKTTTALKLGELQYGGKDKALLLAVDKGYKTMKGVHAVPINSWEELKKTVQILVKAKKTGESEYRVLILDTITQVYDLAEAYVLKTESAKRNKVLDSLSDVGYGALYTILDKEVSKVIKAIQSAGYGVIFIDHDKHTEETTREGDKYTIINPSMSKGARKFVIGMSDIVMYLDYSRHMDDEGEMFSERKMYLNNESTLAETKNRFRNMPPEMPLDPAKFLEALKASIQAEHGDEDEFKKAQETRSKKEVADEVVSVDVEDEDADEVIETTGKSVEELQTDLRGVLQKLPKESKKEAVEYVKKTYGSLDKMTAENLEDVIEKYTKG